MNPTPTLVMLHGHGLSPSIWDFLYAPLANDYGILRPDLSRLIDFNTVETYADEVLGQITSSERGPCVLIGHSMGGYVALAIAEANPDRVKGLVLFNSTAFADTDTDEQRQKRDDGQRLLETEGGPAFIAKMLPTQFSEQSQTDIPDLVRQTVETHKTLPTEALLAGWHAIRNRPDRSDMLIDAPYPVLIIAGRHDKAVPIERSEELHQKLPEAGYVVLERSGHLGMIEEPENSLLALKSFLNRFVEN